MSEDWNVQHEAKDIHRLAQMQNNLAEFQEYLDTRRRALIGQAKALEHQRTAVLAEANWIGKRLNARMVSESELRE